MPASYRFPLVVAEVTALLLIVVLAAALRLTSVRDNPHWYTDEMTHIDIALHLREGQVRYMAIQDSVLLFGRPPLFHLLLASALGGVADRADAVLVLRTLTGTLGVASVLLLYALVRRNGAAALALLAALALAVYPQAVLYSRFGFSYNLLAPLLLAALLGLSAFAQTRRRAWLALAALAVGLGVISDLAALTLVVPFVVVALAARRPLDLLWSLPLLALPAALYAVVMLVRAPDAFLFDLSFTLGRLGPRAPLADQLASLAHNYATLLAQDLWLVAGFIGLFALRPPHLRWASLLVFWLPLLSIGREYALYNLSAYYLIPFLPLVALGVAGLVDAGVRQGAAALRLALRAWKLPSPARRALAYPLAALAVSALVSVPLVESLRPTFAGLDTTLPTQIDGFLLNPDDVRAVAAWVNARSDPDDGVVVSPVVGWLLEARATDFQMTAAHAGRATPHLPANISAERWAFDPSHTSARYVITDNLWYSWGIVHVPGLDAIVRAVEAWPLVYESGQLKVYENPALREAEA